MLTAMTLALAHGHAAPPFNTAFYATAAILILCRSNTRLCG